LKGSLERVSWEEARSDVLKVNKLFVDIVDKLCPGPEFFLYRAAYPFGATVVQNGLLHLPNDDGDIVPISDVSVNEKVQSDFQYAERNLPMGIMTKNSYEVFINTQNYCLPIVAATPGSVLGLWKQLDSQPTFHPVNIFSITAGARNIFMLPNVADFMNHKNLKRDFNVKQQAPKELSEHWSIFKAISDHEQSDWRAELLFLPQAWHDKLLSDEAWEPLHNYFVEYAWESSAYERNQMFYDFVLSCTQAKNNLKPNPYLLDTLKHLLSISLGATPGFKIATDELLGPIDLIQKAYVEVYGLKKYAPTIIHPIHYSIRDPHPENVYYSLQYPTTLSFSPRSRKMTNTLFDLRELKYILEVFLNDVSHKQTNLENTILDAIPENIEYNFYHSKPDALGEVSHSERMIDKNPALARSLSGAEKPFAVNGTFVRGCVSIGKKEND
jgi:hypothetical protein